MIFIELFGLIDIGCSLLNVGFKFIDVGSSHVG